jgi:phosphotransferase system enzyme I (PtsI)
MQRLRRAGTAFDEKLLIGTMVEVPAAALNARALAREVDFFSIGSNDLTQYTLAVDRTNPAVQHLYLPHHPSVLKLIKLVIDAGAEAGKPVSLCGEMAGQPLYVPVLLGLGLRNFSVTPASIPVVKRIIRRVDIRDCQRLAGLALESDTGATVKEHLVAFQSKLPED